MDVQYECHTVLHSILLTLPRCQPFASERGVAKRPKEVERIGAQRIGAQRIGAQRIGWQRMGSQRIGPQRIGPR